MGIKVGIDLGTTFCAVAMIDENSQRPVTVRNSFGETTTPSVLCFKNKNEVLFGEEAKVQQSLGTENCFSFFKRNMGTDEFSVNIFGRRYNASDLSAVLLEKLAKDAERICGQKIDAAVISVPAYFHDKQKDATLQAAKKAKINVLELIYEPAAAAYAYCLNKIDGERAALIYDLGGGTFDITTALINRDKIEIEGVYGDHELGGKNWDDCLVEYLAQKFHEKYKASIDQDNSMIDVLLVAAEIAKKRLSRMNSVKVPINFGNIRGSVEIDTNTFESISYHLLSRTKDLINELFRIQAEYNKDTEKKGRKKKKITSWNTISDVILVGGSTKMKMIHKFVEEMSGNSPVGGVNPDEAVALGAAIRANVIIPKIGGRLNTSLKNNKHAIGGHPTPDLKLSTGHSLGMIAESEDRERYINSKIIYKSDPIPAYKTKPYNFITHDNNLELEVYVLQGENFRPLDNEIVSKYIITKMDKTSPPASIIDVTFGYNSNDLVEVSAIQRETGKQLKIQRIHITGNEDMSWTDLSPKLTTQLKTSYSKAEVMLAIDLSGSMYGDPTLKAKEAMRGFVAEMDSNHVRIGLIAFADKKDCVLSPSDNYSDVLRSIDSIDHANVGGGNKAEPFTLAKSELKGDGSKFIVVLTDGVWFYPNGNGAVIDIAKDCHKNDIDVIALGFGGANVSFLKQIASKEHWGSLTKLTELTSSFSKIAQEIKHLEKTNQLR